MANIDFSQMITREQAAADDTARTEAEETGAAQEYLAATDWYVLRQSETGVAIPEAVQNRRGAARARLNSPR